MNYIGSKRSLLPFLEKSILHITKLSSGVFIDGFAGTGAVGQHFQEKGFSVIANDMQYYSYAINRGKLSGMHDEKWVEKWIEKCNNTNGIEGFIFQNYSAAGTQNQEHIRQYFSDENAKKIDGMRSMLEHEKNTNGLSETEYFYLLYLLLEAADKVANTASVYGAFLKHLKPSAQKPLRICALSFSQNVKPATVYSQSIESLIPNISGDILYLDPPYNARQYAPNYHLLETIAKYDNPVIYGKTGLREYAHQKSDFCVTSKVENALECIIANAKVSYVFLSYNNEGLMNPETIQKIFKKYGECGMETQEYSRFKADKTENRNHAASQTVEYLHWVRIKETN